MNRLGVYTDGNIYGITWFYPTYEEIKGVETEYEKKYTQVLTDEQRQEIYADFLRLIPEYEKKYTQVLTDEQRQEIYADFLRLIPEKVRSLYHYRVYTRVTYTPDTEDSYFFTWFPFDLKHVLAYLENRKVEPG